MTIPEIYALAEKRMPVHVWNMGSAHPFYQEELKRLVDEITRDLALQHR